MPKQRSTTRQQRCKEQHNNYLAGKSSQPYQLSQEHQQAVEFVQSAILFSLNAKTLSKGSFIRDLSERNERIDTPARNVRILGPIEI